MSRVRVFAMILAICGATFAIAPVASASETMPFGAVITEDFCEPGVTCGTAVTLFGRATVRSVITSFTPLPSGCFSDHHISTLTFADGSTLANAIVGTLCPTTFPNFRLEGTYSVTGTGRFAGATGSGFVRAFRENGPIHAVLVGTLG